MEDAGIIGLSELHQRSWAIVCDGIGGQPGGKEAAFVCVETLDKFFNESSARQMISQAADFVKLSLLPVLDAFYNHVQKKPKHLHMGCTFAMAYFEHRKVCLAWCGDSRIYHFRNGKLIYKSLPHNTVYDEYRKGNIGLRKAESIKTNIITRCVSASDSFPVLEVKNMVIKPGDRFLICTDGVWNTLVKSDFYDIAVSCHIRTIAAKLQLKLERSADDNFWGIIIELKS